MSRGGHTNFSKISHKFHVFFTKAAAPGPWRAARLVFIL
nr:MAG TPA: hypothetical protein [Caudoviricetes sp.]